MEATVNGTRRKRSFMSLLIERFIPALSWLLVTASLTLEKFAESRMGVYRSLSVRNQSLSTGLFAPSNLSLYMGIIAIGLAVCLLLFVMSRARFSKQGKERSTSEGSQTFRESSKRRRLNYLLRTSLLSVLLVVLLWFYPSATWPAYPWIVISTGAVLMTHYLRIACVGVMTMGSEEAGDYGNVSGDNR
ncbi:MAG: hypothetical protein Q8J63_07175 [Candidatus Aquicultor sp.]|nr:hypothetical protein [Candidatus Aquicultor sp.]